MAVFGQRIIALWVRKESVVPSRQLLLTLCGYFLLMAWVVPHAILINGVDRMKCVVSGYIAWGILNLILSIVLVRPYRQEGVALAVLLACGLTIAWFIPYQCRKILKQHASDAPS